MIQTMRWYGSKDPVSLQDIRQAGASGVVHAMHEIKNGEVWSLEALQKRKTKIEAAGLEWKVVESLPITEAMKTRTGNFKQHIANYKASLINLGEIGVEVVCYNFMPVLDWTRTQLAYPLENGATALRFDWSHLAAFDCFILKRKNAEQDYNDSILTEAKRFFEQATSEDKQQLEDAIIAGLPGSEEGYTLAGLQKAIDSYSAIDERKAEEHLKLFLDEVLPTAESSGIAMAIHPDDPPHPFFGLPRIMSKASDIKRLLADNDNAYNGVTFCTGSFGARADNDLVQIVKGYGKHIHFVHLRSTKRDVNGSFYEDNHLDGDVPMAAVIYELLEVEKQYSKQIPMRPDHGHQMLDDLKKPLAHPGYTAIGRLKGLAEIRGVINGIEFMQNR
ncbi:mannonate dehydratase [Leeuwenhoekiella marinoflava]|uniref:Mannonate dehydratase n=2 Tax=Leeuwenhoekiella marinoflava TaxID=988 RepID=A0A4Q0PJJ4_9FLAO|nr:mannonate dehydratase [Leeuwenhoekiella marinoflava]RXG27633.1 D-mannonate dehydratase [Leeuwenhoekiella marinoflava]SHF67582.1 mannonate dehydratase [Leeuwenhoekiella marinoflava DSM 3653]